MTSAETGASAESELPPNEPIRFDPWIDDLQFDGGGEQFGAMVAAFRGLSGALTLSRPDEATMTAVIGGMTRLRTLLESSASATPTVSAQGAGFSGNRYDLPGRGHPHLIPLVVDRWETNHLEGTVTFGPQHVGGAGAVHGGMQPLLFDETFGRLGNANRVTRARTAYLHVEYRRVTLIGVQYRVEATVDREEGRKRFMSARLIAPDGVVVSEADGLLVALRDGAP